MQLVAAFEASFYLYVVAFPNKWPLGKRRTRPFFDAGVTLSDIVRAVTRLGPSIAASCTYTSPCHGSL